MKIGLLTGHASPRAAGVWVGVARLGKALLESGLDVEIFGIADAWTATDCAATTATSHPPLMADRGGLVRLTVRAVKIV